MDINESGKQLIGYDGCFCRLCIQEAEYNGTIRKMIDWLPVLAQIMVVCETCGNKRCPHATDHDLTCTDSNEPGQPGSDY